MPSWLGEGQINFYFFTLWLGLEKFSYLWLVKDIKPRKWKLHVIPNGCCLSTRTHGVIALKTHLESSPKVKVKCTLVQALRLCTGLTAHRENRGIALLFHDHGTRRGWGVSVTPRPLFTPRKDPVLIVQEAGWTPGPVWTGAENIAPIGIRSPDRPVHQWEDLKFYTFDAKRSRIYFGETKVIRYT
jgi:hypothetical protein